MTNSKGYLVGFFGPDGSGKSTTADLVEKLCLASNIKTKRYHWRPRVLPSLRKNAENAVVTQPDELKTRSGIISFLMYFYFYFDFSIAYYFKLRTEIENDVIIIYERYYYDALFHPKRYKLKPMPLIVSFLARIVPAPDLLILMGGDAASIHERKPELSVSEISRQQSAMSACLPNYSKVVEIDVIQNNADDCARIVFDNFSDL